MNARRAVAPLVVLIALVALVAAPPARAFEWYDVARDDFQDNRDSEGTCRKPGGPLMFSPYCGYMQARVATTCLVPPAFPDTHCARRRIDVIRYRGGTGDPSTGNLSGGCEYPQHDAIETELYGTTQSVYQGWRLERLTINTDGRDPAFVEYYPNTFRTNCDVEGATFEIRPSPAIEFTELANVELLFQYECHPWSVCSHGGLQWKSLDFDLS